MQDFNNINDNLIHFMPEPNEINYIIVHVLLHSMKLYGITSIYFFQLVYTKEITTWTFHVHYD